MLCDFFTMRCTFRNHKNIISEQYTWFLYISKDRCKSDNKLAYVYFIISAINAL